MVVVGLDGLVDLFLLNIRQRTQLTHRRTALVLLLELRNLILNLRQSSHLVEGQTHDTALLGNGLQNALANPPDSIGYELEATRLIEFLRSANQSNVAFVDQVGQRQTLMLILLGNRHNETQVGIDQLLFCTLTGAATFADLLCQFDFLFNGDHGHASNLNKIFVE